MVETLLRDILNGLGKRSRDVIVRRAGLKNNRPETLEFIGQSYGVTRERVRQIEASARRAILSKQMPERFADFTNIAFEHLKHTGGAREENRFLEELRFLTQDAHPASRARLGFLLGLTQKFVRHEETERFQAFWAVDDNMANRVIKFLDFVVGDLKKRRTTVLLTEIDSYLAKIGDRVTGLMKEAGPTALIGFVAISKEILINPFGECGLAEWSQIVPRGVKDRAYYLMHQKKEPLHFRKIATMLNQHAELASDFHPAWQKPIEVQTVHNELIKDDRFVLVGRGTYALAEWGYRPGTVKDVIIEVLRLMRRPMSKDEIVKTVKEKRQVRENTILINLQNKRLFERLPDGRYRVRERKLLKGSPRVREA